MIKNTLLRGILFLIPVSIVAVVLGQLFGLSMKIAQALDSIIPADDFVGIALSNILVILVLVAILLLGGLISYLDVINNKVLFVDLALSKNMPGYMFFKSLLGGDPEACDSVNAMTPVLVMMGPYKRIAFEVGRFSDQVIVFLPNQPAVFSGSSLIVDASQVEKLQMNTRQAVALLQVHGKGLEDLLEQEAAFGGQGNT